MTAYQYNQQQRARELAYAAGVSLRSANQTHNRDLAGQLMFLSRAEVLMREAFLAHPAWGSGFNRVREEIYQNRMRPVLARLAVLQYGEAR